MTLTSSVDARGFTLLELLIVLSIIVLGVGLMAPNVALTDNSAFRAEIRRAASTLSYARRLAIVQATPVTARLSTSSDEDLSTQEPLTEEQRQRHWHSELLQLRYQDEVQGSPESVDAVDITFFPQGGSTGGTLHFSRDQRSAMISISAITGRISVGWDGEEADDET